MSCAELATSRKCQCCYVGVSAFISIAMVAMLVMMIFTEAEAMNVDGLEWFLWLVILGSGITMTASRCCVPACCPQGNEAIPKPCPPTCFVCLDCPYIGLAGYTLVVGTLDMCLALFVAEEGSLSFLRIFRLLRLVPVVLAIAAFVTAIIKYCQMPGSTKVEQAAGAEVVVGMPVQVEPTETKQ